MRVGTWHEVILVIVILVAMLMVGGSVSVAQGPTSTFAPPTATPDGVAMPTFIPSAPQPAIPITIGETTAGVLSVGRWEIYEFVGQANQRVTIRLRSSDFDAVVELYSPLDYQTPFLTDDESGRGRNATLYNIALPVDGLYRVFARSYNGAGGEFLFSVEANAGYIPAENERQTISYGQVLEGNLLAEADYYAFSGAAGDVVSVLLSSAAFDAYLQLMDGNGIILAENDDNGRNKDAAVANAVLPADGIYFLIAASYNLNASGSYSIELLKVNEGGVSTGGVLQLNQTQRARLFPNVQVEWTFEGTSGQVISLGAMAVGTPDEFDLIFELVPPSGGGILDDDGGYDTNPALVDYTLTQTGTYTVRLREYNASIGGLYDMMLYEGRRYFSPSGTPSSHLALDAGGQAVIINALENPTERYALYTITLPTNRLFAAEVLAGNGGSGFPQDFRVQVFDTTWQPIVESLGGVVTELVPIQTDYLLLVEYRGPGLQTYQMMVEVLDAPPQRLTLPILGTLLAAQPVESVLTTGTRHARLFIAPTAGNYRFTLNKRDATDAYDPYLYLLDTSGGILAQDDDSVGGIDAQIARQLAIGEQVVVVVAGFADATAGLYRITVEQE